MRGEKNTKHFAFWFCSYCSGHTRAILTPNGQDRMQSDRWNEEINLKFLPWLVGGCCYSEDNNKTQSRGKCACFILMRKKLKPRDFRTTLWQRQHEDLVKKLGLCFKSLLCAQSFQQKRVALCCSMDLHPLTNSRSPRPPPHKENNKGSCDTQMTRQQHGEPSIFISKASIHQSGLF